MGFIVTITYCRSKVSLVTYTTRQNNRHRPPVATVKCKEINVLNNQLSNEEVLTTRSSDAITPVNNERHFSPLFSEDTVYYYTSTRTGSDGDSTVYIVPPRTPLVTIAPQIISMQCSQQNSEQTDVNTTERNLGNDTTVQYDNYLKVLS